MFLLYNKYILVVLGGHEIAVYNTDTYPQDNKLRKYRIIYYTKVVICGQNNLRF